jgi:hypothetical protein
MSTSSAVATAASFPVSRERMERLFYLLSSSVILVIVGMGFQQFYLHGRASGGGPVTQQIVALVFLHGIAMSAWIILLALQSALIVAGNRKLHMTLGAGGVVLAGLLVVLGLTTAISSVHYNPDAYKGIWGARPFLSLMLTNILGFGTLAGIGLKNRKRPEIHRPVMLLATLFAAGPAGLFRIPYVSGPIMGTIHNMMAVWTPMLILGGLLLILKSAMTRSLDRYFAGGFIGIVVACVLQVFVSSSAWWSHVAGWVTA